MTDTSIYKDIAARTGGDIYIGVVGPVRTGKSTLIKKFMENLVMPNIQNEYDRTRARDELPQSAAGKTVMTAEPKFIPDEAVEVTLDDGARARIKLIDCVGYIVPDALGYIENGAPRMVNTPWSSNPMPFGEAAEFGTRKVIRDHSTIGLLVTCDGTISDIPRQQYIDAEERVAKELKDIKKPYAILLNSSDPNSESAINLALELENKYGAPVALVNCLQINSDDIRHILGLILQEFPIKEIKIDLPGWTTALDSNHWLIQTLDKGIMECASQISKMGQAKEAFAKLAENEYITGVRTKDIDMGSGKAAFDVELDPELYYKIMSELTGLEIENEEQLITLMRDLATVKKKYDRVAEALNEVEENGYGIVMPEISDLRMEEPKIVKQSGGYGVQIKALAPSIHMIKADMETEINPIVGSESQSKELVDYLMKLYEENPEKIWDTNMFGKTLKELVDDGLRSKLENMPDEARAKMSETLTRIINEGSGGLICIIL